MNILTCDFTEAAERCRFRKFDVILIKAPGQETPYTRLIEKTAQEILVLEFEDLELPHPGKRMPEKQDVIKAIQWSKGRESFLVVCSTGLGLSPALAFVLLCTEMTAAEAAEYLWDPETTSPNERIVAIGADLLKNQEMIMERVKLAQADLDMVDKHIVQQKEFVDDTPLQAVEIDPEKKKLLLQQFGISFGNTRAVPKPVPQQAPRIIIPGR